MTDGAVPLKQQEKKPTGHRWLWGTYAVDVVTSCQLLLRFCFSSLNGVIPSFRLISAKCLSLEARTWVRVWISSSTCRVQQSRPYLQVLAINRFGIKITNASTLTDVKAHQHGSVYFVILLIFHLHVYRHNFKSGTNMFLLPSFCPFNI